MSIHRPKRVTYRATREPSPFGDSAEDDKPPEWTEAVEGKVDKDFKPFSVKATYAVGNLLRHPKFGNGVVLAVEAQKMDVLFESGARKLAHSL